MDTTALQLAELERQFEQRKRELAELAEKIRQFKEKVKETAKAVQ